MLLSSDGVLQIAQPLCEPLEGVLRVRPTPQVLMVSLCLLLHSILQRRQKTHRKEALSSGKPGSEEVLLLLPSVPNVAGEW